MSVGKVVRKIVKKWLKKDEAVDTHDCEEELCNEEDTDSLQSECYQHQQPQHPHPLPHPCMFCSAGDDDCSRQTGDLNRNIHISSEMGYSRENSTGYSKCYFGGNEMMDFYDYWCLNSSPFSSGPLHGTIPSVSGGDGGGEYPPFGSACSSSQSPPVPVCVCEACYIVVSSHLSNPLLPSTLSPGASPRGSPRGSPSGSPRSSESAAAGQPQVCNAEFGCCPRRCQARGGDGGGGGGGDAARMVSSGLFRSGSREVKEQTTRTDCNKDSPVSTTLDRRSHSVLNEKSPPPSSSSSGCKMEPVEGSASTGRSSLPASVRASLDGEEGFLESQRRVRDANRRHDLAQRRFRPPPNKTICHVAK